MFTLKNHTRWRNEDLRAIVQKVLDEELNPDQRNHVTIHIVPRRARRTSEIRASRTAGYIQRRVGHLPPGLKYNQGIVTMRQPASSGKMAREQLALLVAHECAEMRGLDHGRGDNAMRSPRYFFKPGWKDRYAWATALPLRPQEQPPKPTREKTWSMDLKTAEARLADWTRRERLAGNRKRKWTLRIKRLKAKLALAPTALAAASA